MNAQENANMILHTVSDETAAGRAARRAAVDVTRLLGVRKAAADVLRFEYPRPDSEGAHVHSLGRKLWKELRGWIEATS